MPRLIIFGCSFSYGDGLPDCYIEGRGPAFTSSKYVWGELLGKEMGLETINCSNPGASNLRILNTILNFDFYPTDTIIVQWTFSERDVLFLDTLYDIGPWVNTDIVKHFYQAHSNDDLVTRNLMHIHHADCFLKRISPNVTHFMLDHDILYNKIITDKPKWFDVNLNPINFHNLSIDKSIDGMHPGLLSQPIISKHIKEELNVKY